VGKGEGASRITVRIVRKVSLWTGAIELWLGIF